MNLRLNLHQVGPSDSLRALVEQKTRKVQRLLPTFSSGDLDLHVTLERTSRGRQYHAVLVLTLPQVSIRAEDMEETPASSLLRAFDELSRRVVKFKSRLNREHLRQKPPSQPQAPAAPIQEDTLQRAIDQNLDRLENYVRRELYHQSLLAGLPAGAIEAPAVLDEVFLEARSQAGRKPEGVGMEHWLVQIARERVRERIEAWESGRGDVHVQESAPSAEQWHDETLNFYQPDESLRQEDVLPDPAAATPEELLDRQERAEQLRRSIATLPEPLRESFVLFVLEGFTSDEVAMIMGKTPRHVLEAVQEAQRQLRSRIGAR